MSRKDQRARAAAHTEAESRATATHVVEPVAESAAAPPAAASSHPAERVGEPAADRSSNGAQLASSDSCPTLHRPAQRQAASCQRSHAAHATTSTQLDDYKSIVGQAQMDALRFLARSLKGKTIKMVNSTAVGGGVAEMLNRLVPLLSRTRGPHALGRDHRRQRFLRSHQSVSQRAARRHVTSSRDTLREIFLMYNEQNRAAHAVQRRSGRHP